MKTDASLKEEWATTKEELLLRHEAEKGYAKVPVIFYATRPIEKLSFLFDYCFTHGCIDLTHPEEWLKKKLFISTGLQNHLDSTKLMTAAKLSIGKELTWWKKILQDLEELISIDQEILPFLDAPERTLNKMEPDVRKAFEEKLFELIGQPFMKKSPDVLAKEVVNMVFNGLLYNDIPTKNLGFYRKWVDSNIYEDSLRSYISKYKVPNDVNIWDVHPDHCFETVDLLILKKICSSIHDKAFIKEKIEKITIRSNNSKKNKFVPEWWKEVITLLSFDSKAFVSCTDLDKAVDFYTSKFYKVDRAIRNLYMNFLHDESIIRPLQEYYDGLNGSLLQHWFDLIDGYKPYQQGYLPIIFQHAKPGTAVIVGDGVRYEMASYVAEILNSTKEIEVDEKIILADIPSETEHNMSALYFGNNQVIPIHKDREKKLVEKSGKPITFGNLEHLHYGIKEDFLVLTYKDIDSTGEKLQQGALKLFAEFEKVLIEKIRLLFKMNYEHVYLVTDHGFVLTGILTESDKIPSAVIGKKQVHERFIRTVEKQNNPEWIRFEKQYGEFNYVYVSKNQRPFVSKGVYGFSHGGLTPQEVIIPAFHFSKSKKGIKGLDVLIVNKNDLKDVTGELFGIRVRGFAVVDDLFSSERKVQLLVYSNEIKLSSSQVISIEPNVEKQAEFSFSGNSEVTVVLIDAVTQEQLDSAPVKKSNARDLGGLF